MKLEYSGIIKDGKLVVRNRKQFDSEVQSAFKEGKEVWVTVDSKRSKRSDQQNRYWWVAVTILGNHFGYRKDEMHEILKFRFLKAERVDETTGEVFEYLRSSAGLNKTEFAEMTDAMIQWSAEHGVVIPLPNTQMELLTS